MYFIKKSFIFVVFLTLCNLISPLSAVTNQHSKNILILENNIYDIKWFRGIYYSWEIKNFAHMNNISLQDAFIIHNTLKDKELYLIPLSKLIFHINQAFQNNPLYKNFNTSNSLPYNLFNFFSYIHSLQQNSPEEVDNILKNEFNLYEIVSIKRLSEENLSDEIAKTKHTIAKYNLTDNKIEELSNEYESLNIQDLVFSKKEHNDRNMYISCLKKETSSDLIDHITQCNEVYGKENKENLLIGIRKCYLHSMSQIKTLTESELNNTIMNLHLQCAPLVNTYLKTYSNNKFLQRYLMYLIGSYLEKIKHN